MWKTLFFLFILFLMIISSRVGFPDERGCGGVAPYPYIDPFPYYMMMMDSVTRDTDRGLFPYNPFNEHFETYDDIQPPEPTDPNDLYIDPNPFDPSYNPGW